MTSRPTSNAIRSSKRDLVVIGGSAGCLDALRSLLSALPRDLAAAILIVVHTSRSRPGALADVLGRATALPVQFPRERERLRRAQVIVASPDYHLIVEGGNARAVHGPREGGFRPAIDPLFRTAAATFGRRVVGVILSGALDDGSFGLAAVKSAGGFAVVQSPDEALFASMPLSALESADVDAILPVEKIAALLVEQAGVGRPRALPPPSVPLPGPDVAEQGSAGIRGGPPAAPPSAYTCPECGGALWEVRRDHALGFRCHVGHAYGAASFLAHQTSAVEGALWTALRALEEAVSLRRRMAAHAVETGLEALARAYLDGAEDAERKADAIRAVLTDPREPGAESAFESSREEVPGSATDS